MKIIKTYESFTDDIKSVGKKVSGFFSDQKTRNLLNDGLEKELIDRISSEYSDKLINYEIDIDGDEIYINDLDSPESLTFYLYNLKDDTIEKLER